MTEIDDFTRANAADPQADFRELFVRLIFTDPGVEQDYDHLKNLRLSAMWEPAAGDCLRFSM